MAERTGGPSPAEMSLRGRLAAHTRWATEDPVAGTEAARRRGPGRIDYWLERVDPEGVLSETERRRRAEQAKRAYYAKLQLQSAKARRQRANPPDAA